MSSCLLVVILSAGGQILAAEVEGTPRITIISIGVSLEGDGLQGRPYDAPLVELCSSPS